MVRDVRNGEVYAHDLVHRAVNVYALGGENEVELQVDGEEGVDTDGEDEGAEEAEVNATDLEVCGRLVPRLAMHCVMVHVEFTWTCVWMCMRMFFASAC